MSNELIKESTITFVFEDKMKSLPLHSNVYGVTAVVTGLRGPDNENWFAKVIGSCILRQHVSGYNYGASLTIQDVRESFDEELKEIDMKVYTQKFIEKCEPHYAHHQERAFNCLVAIARESYASDIIIIYLGLVRNVWISTERYFNRPVKISEDHISRLLDNVEKSFELLYNYIQKIGFDNMAQRYIKVTED